MNNTNQIAVPPVQSVVKDIKKEQIIAEYAKQTNLPISILELVYDTCEKLDEKKLKQLRKGQLKLKHPLPKRPVFEPNQTIIGVEVLAGVPEEYPVSVAELPRIEEITL